MIEQRSNSPEARTLEQYLAERRTRVLGWSEMGSAAKDLWTERTKRSYYAMQNRSQKGA